MPVARRWDEAECVPVPRFPWFVYVSYKNWFKTTVNPIVWELNPVRLLRPTAEEVGRCSELVAFGYELDSHLWMRPREWAAAVFDPEQCERRPDAIFESAVGEYLFALITSGRRSDTEQAVRFVKAMARRFAGEIDRRVILEGWGREVAWAKPKKNPARRDRLAESLGVQLLVWQRHLADPSATQSGTARLASDQEDSDVGLTHATEHVRILSEYRSFFVEREEMRTAAGSLLGEDDVQDFASVALASLEGAIQWLKGPGSQ